MAKRHRGFDRRASASLRVAVVALAFLSWSGAALAEPPVAPDDAPDEPAEAVENASPSTGETPATDVKTPAGRPPLTDDALERSLDALRTIEARLSVGDEIGDKERGILIVAALEGKSPEERALATAILPWLGPADALDALLQASADPDARVRAEAHSGLAVLARRLTPDGRERAWEAVNVGLGDTSDDVACAAAGLAWSLDPERTRTALEGRADAASDVRYGCWRQLAGLPARALEVPPPVMPEIVDEKATPAETVERARRAADGGRYILVATAAGAGLGIGALIPGMLVPARDGLTYTKRRTTVVREEPSMVWATAGGLVGAAALGAAAYYGTELLPPLDYAPAAGAVLSTATGALVGLGLSMSLALDPPLASLSTALGTLGGLSAGAAWAWLLAPKPRHITFVAATTGLAAMGTTLGVLAAIPEGFPLVFDFIPRLDLAIGGGLVLGALGGAAAAGIAPVVDLPHGRVLASAGAAAAGAGTAMFAAYLFVPVGIDEIAPVSRNRIAAVSGIAAAMLIGPTVFFLLPDAWANALDPVKEVATQGALISVDDEKLGVGLPNLWATPDRASPGRLAWGITLLGGRF